MASLDFEKEKSDFKDFYDNNHDVLESAKDSFIAIIRSILSQEFALSSIIGRIKNREECIEKFSLKYQTSLEKGEKEYQIKDHITDLIGLRIVTLYEADIQKIKNILSKEFKLIDITDKIKDMESHESSFGYKGLHIDLKLQTPRNTMSEYAPYKDFKFEVQIRTIIQDAWSVLDHEIKYKKSIPHQLKRRINTLAALFELADHEFYNISKVSEDTIQDTKIKEKDQLSTTDTLNVFSFLAVVEKYFKKYDFIPYKADGFVSEIIKYNAITPTKFKQIIGDGFSEIEEYRRYIEKGISRKYAFNPYTEIRHILYKSNPKKYERILYNFHRTSFQDWINERSDIKIIPANR